MTHDLRVRPLVAEMYHAGVFAEGGGRYEDENIRCCLLLAERGEGSLA